MLSSLLSERGLHWLRHHSALATGGAGLLMVYPEYCSKDDTELAEWTILRYLVIAAIVTGRVVYRMEADGENGLRTWPRRFFLSGVEFINHEGIGLVIYFMVSAMLDNFVIFLDQSGKSGSYCGYVKMVALYSMALITFLPTCLFAYVYQDKLFDSGDCKKKAGFISAMVIITVLFFQLRLLMVYNLGYADFVKKNLTPWPHRVPLAVLVPPVVDGLQSLLLIACSRLSSLYAGEDKDI
eukprot:TRINITY_DN83561_c0_g1_i1.p1 TRINITY_DN83561_c0_g1~~TRINITY_DN83561_c0_g1_i1.p1  ORF type:complete len:239 (+),score=47.51 TRINITY_DN83561_c0_g1_i1:43-759(+)